MPVNEIARKVIQGFLFELADAGKNCAAHKLKEYGVNLEVVMLWAGHESDSDVKTSRVDRGYTTYSEEYLLAESKKIDYDYA